MDQTTERAEPERKVTWEIIPPDQLPVILANTIEETAFQSAAVASSSAQLLKLIPPQQEERRKKTVEGLVQATSDAVKELLTIQSFLRKDPSTPIPIDHSYGPGHLIIALDQVGNRPAPQNPTSEGK